jgi:hypothetical protein
MIPGATTQIYNAPYDGVYSVIATDPNFCNSVKSNTINILTSVGIQNSKDSHSLKIYPNPTTGLFIIEINGLKENTSVEIINELGQTIHSSIIKDCTDRCLYEVDLSNFPNGVYFAKITSDNTTEYRKISLNK